MFPFMCEIRSLQEIDSEYILDHQLNERCNGSTVCFLRGVDRVSKFYYTAPEDRAGTAWGPPKPEGN